MLVRRRSFALVTVLLAVTAAALVLPAIAAPTPLSEKKARLREVQAKLDTVGTKAEVAVEHYNQAVSKLETVRARMKENQRLLDVTTRNLAVANRQLSARAENLYKAPSAGLVDVVLSVRTFDELVTQMDLMQRIGDSDVDLVRSITAYKQEVKNRRVELRANERAAKEFVEERSQRKTEVLALEAQLEDMTRGIKSDIKRLQEQAEARARAAAAAAAAQVSDPSTGTPPSGTSDPGGGYPQVVEIAKRYLGIPYVWGGASPSTGFDCSGLTMYVYAQVGVSLSHGATDQQRASKPVPLSSLQPGDLVFFGNASFSHHVGIYAGGGTMINAPNSGSVVRYDSVWSDAWIGGRF